MRSIITLCLLFITTALCAQQFVQIENRWLKDGKTTYTIHVQEPTPDAGAVEPGWWSKDWVIEDAGGGFVRIKNRWRGTYMHNQKGALTSGDIQPGWHSAQWALEATGDGYHRIKNRWKGTYLHTQNTQLELGDVQPNWYSAQWKLQGYKGSTPAPQPKTPPKPRPQTDPQPKPKVDPVSPPKDADPAGTSYAMGATKTPSENLALVQKIDKVTVSGGAPAMFELDMPPIGNQGVEGSCVGWAVGYAAMSYEMKKNSGVDYVLPGTDLLNMIAVASPEYLFNRINANNDNCESGSWFVGTPDRRGAFDLLKYEGITPWMHAPYSDKNGCGNVENHKEEVFEVAADFRIAGYAEVKDFKTASLKQLLRDGYPIIIGANLSKEFKASRGVYIWKDQGVDHTGKHGKHAMVVIGYDDAKGAFKLQNSWGTGWGDEGYGWLAYDHFANVVFEAYVLHAGSLRGYEVRTPQYVTVYSEALYVANVKLTYNYRGQAYKEEKKLSAFFSFEHEIPHGATDVKLDVDGIACFEPDVITKSFSGSDIRACYKIWGSPLDTESALIDCSY